MAATKEKPPGLDLPAVARIIKYGARAHVPVFRMTNGRVADPGERATLWPRLVDLYADFESHQAWTDREIPVVVLEPRGT